MYIRPKICTVSEWDVSLGISSSFGVTFCALTYVLTLTFVYGLVTMGVWITLKRSLYTILGLCRYIDKPIYTVFCSTIRFGYRSRGVSIQREATQP